MANRRPCRDHGSMYVVDTRAEVIVVDDEVLIVVYGELDAFSMTVLEDALADVPATGRVVIDLQHAPFLDCAALRRIETAARTLAAHGRTLRVDNVSDMVRRLMDLLKLDDLRVR